MNRIGFESEKRISRYRRCRLSDFSRNVAQFLISAVLLIPILTSTANAVNISWTSHGPDGGSIKNIVIDPITPSTLYAGAWWGGIYKSTDSGANWTELNTGRILNGVRAIAVDPVTPATVYASIPGGIIKSTDGGLNWTTVNNGLTNNYVYTLAIDPYSATVIYAGTMGGIFKSTDGGANWFAVNTGLTNNYVSALAIDIVTSTTLYAGTSGGGLFKSTDGGSNWTTLSIGPCKRPGMPTPSLYIKALAVDPITPGTIYLVNSDGVCRSANAGSSWVFANTGITSSTILSLVVDPATSGTVYAGTGNGVFKTADSGGQWGRVDAGPTFSNVYSFAFDPTTLAVYAGTDAGIIRSLNSGASWTMRSQGLKELMVNAVTVDPITPATVYAGTDGGGVFKSTDKGATWSVVNTGLATGSISRLAIDPVAPAILYAGTGLGILKTTDGGANWSASSNGMMGHDSQALVVDPVVPSVLYSGSSLGRVFRSVDGGGNWTSVKTDACDVRSLAVDPITSTIVYLGTNGCGLFRSTDSGATWGPLTVVAGVNTIATLAIDPSAPTVIYATGDLQRVINTYTPPTSVYKSVDGGMNWMEVNFGLPYAYLYSIAIDPVATSNLYIGTANGIYKSIDGGGSWVPANTGLTNYVYTVAIDPVSASTLYAGTRDGVYSATIHPVLIVMRSGSGNGTITSGKAEISCGTDCSEPYSMGTEVTLTAMPDADSTFAGWSGACSGTNLTCIVTMDAAKSVTASFDQQSLARPANIWVRTTTNIATNPVVWGASTTADVTYEVEEDTTASFTNPRAVYSGTALRTDVTVSGPGTYYYRVRATKAGYQPSGWVVSIGSTATFTAAKPASIWVRTTTNITTNPVVWGASATAGVTYEVEEDTTTAFTNPRAVYSGIALRTDVTVNGPGTYYYRVRATKAGWQPSAWKVSIGGTVTLTAAKPVSIWVRTATNITTNPVVWGASTTAGVTYEVEEDTTTSFTNPRAVYSGTTLRTDVTVSGPGTYYYRVRATKAGWQPSAWKVSIGSTVTLTAAIPASIWVRTATNITTNPVVWGASPTAGVTYEVEEDTTIAFTNSRPVYSGTGLRADVTVGGSGTYYYRVRATKAGYQPSAWKVSIGSVVVLP